MNPIPTWPRLLAHLVLACGALAAAVQAAERTQVTTGVVHASADELWTALTTADGEVRAFGVAQAAVDLRVGGSIKTHFDAAKKLGDPGTSEFAILAYEPGRMLATSIKPAAGSPEKLVGWCARVWHVVRLEPLGPKLARWTETGCGYGDDADSDEAFAFFEKANASRLAQLQKAFSGEDAPKSGEAVLARLRTLVGGEYIAKEELSGDRVVLAHTRWSAVLGNFVLAEGWLSDDGQPLREHSHTLYGIDPASGAASFWKFGAGGNLARGTLAPDGERSVGHDWTLDTPGAPQRRLYVEIEVRDGGYLYRAQPSVDDRTTILEFEYRRVDTLPPEYAHAAR